MTTEAGRELDAKIAELVMGGRWEGGYLYSHVEVPTTVQQWSHGAPDEQQGGV